MLYKKNICFFQRVLVLLILLSKNTSAQTRIGIAAPLNIDLPEIVDPGGILLRTPLLDISFESSVLFDLPENFSLGTGLNIKGNPLGIKTTMHNTAGQTSGDFQFDVPLIFTWKKKYLNSIFEPHLSIKPGWLPNTIKSMSGSLDAQNAPTLEISYQHLSAFIVSYNIGIKESFILSKHWSTALLIAYNKGLNAGSTLNITYKLNGISQKAQIINKNTYYSFGICFNYLL